jgi:REP element-mobilizing transposase RayT
MARPLRCEEAGAAYHVAARGSSGQTIFRDDRDRRVFFGLLDRGAMLYRWELLAYCLMTNHFHFLVRIPEGGLSAGMQWLLTGYSRATNKRYGKSDHLFRQHFRSIKLERESHLLESARYIALNPVRAGLCEEPQQWQWSSYGACAGLAYVPHFLAADELLKVFHARPSPARRRYREFVASARDADVRHTTLVSDTVTEA